MWEIDWVVTTVYDIYPHKAILDMPQHFGLVLACSKTCDIYAFHMSGHVERPDMWITSWHRPLDLTGKSRRDGIVYLSRISGGLDG